MATTISPKAVEVAAPAADGANAIRADAAGADKGRGSRSLAGPDGNDRPSLGRPPEGSQVSKAGRDGGSNEARNVDGPKLSVEQHTAVLREMMEMQRSNMAYDQSGKPNPRYVELLDKIDQHVHAQTER